MLSRAFLKLHYMREYPVMNSWSSVHLMNFGKIQEEGQSAGNFELDKGASETTREAIKLDENFKWWFIGFTEGDGSFILNKDGYLEFKITQSSVDAQILFYIKKQLGFGSVSLQDKVNKTHHFRVRDKNNILKLIQIFNGNILTKFKLNQFKLWVGGFNKIYKMDILCIEPKHKLNLDNAWLSGFTDAEGCFTSSVLTSKITGKTIVTVRYVVSQKDDVEFSKNLADMLNGYITHVKSYNGYNTVVNHGKLNKILKYLHDNPLKTKKLISYHRWLKIYWLVKNKKHFTAEGLIVIKFITKIINQI
uniref:LAGLIDADG endonuclease n=2 Tax=Monilinia TaxID=38447 RepID=A0A8F8SQU9_MONFR|nr:LAGLIDADG endonuclease [Monilinia laxa]QYB19684.1 LAGLIDADG endonuclease [Monilinia fructicola]QOE17471.1 LAGLIDADG endonuclease [Monilinia laxa]QYB19809.1 LAGLIDADG endonuclease [Monilinia fructicola]QYB19891.1 LAGLIDADG endonuclease [Monilinia laxa]QYB19976.1 LAGLIDADG endonuclease [Monilinia laxa]